MFMKENTTQVRIDNHIYTAIQAVADEMKLSTAATTMLLLELALIHTGKHPGVPKEMKEKLLARGKERILARQKERPQKLREE